MVGSSGIGQSWLWVETSRQERGTKGYESKVEPDEITGYFLIMCLAYLCDLMLINQSVINWFADTNRRWFACLWVLYVRAVCARQILYWMKYSFVKSFLFQNAKITRKVLIRRFYSQHGGSRYKAAWYGTSGIRSFTQNNIPRCLLLKFTFCTANICIFF